MTFDEWLSGLAGDAAMLHSLAANEFLFRRGDETVGVYVVVSGSVKMARTGLAGKDAVLYVAHSGEPLAEASIFSPIYHCDAVAVTAAKVRFYPKAALTRRFERDHRFAEAYLAMLGRQLMIARTRFERVCLHSARDRVLHFLMLEADNETGSVEIAGTLKEFASELGLTHEAFYRTLAQMAKDREIERDGNVIKLLSVSPVVAPASPGKNRPRRTLNSQK